MTHTTPSDQTARRQPDAERPGCEVGHTVLWLAETDSTNRLASDLAQRGARHGTVVLADHQSAGSGKGARRWFSTPGGGLCVSMVLRPRAKLSVLPQLTLVAAVAMVQAIVLSGVPSARLKWPNDILIGDRKVCGILAESGQSDLGVHVVIGAGLNVNLADGGFPPDIRGIATSLAIAAGHPFDAGAVLGHYLEYFEHWLDVWLTHGFAPVRDAWMAMSCTIGRVATFQAGREIFTGEATGLDLDGALLLRTGDGRTHRFHSGELQLLPRCSPQSEPSHERYAS